MPALFFLAQIEAPAPKGWWWSTLISRPALLLIALGLGCLVVMVFLGVRLRRVSATQRTTTLRQRFSDDSGVAMIEFVLVTPILLFITLLLLQTALVFTGLFYVQYAAFAAARSAIVHIPIESTEPINHIMPVRGSDKFDAVESAAMFAVLPVSGRENGSRVSANEMVAGVRSVYQAQDKEAPAWVDNLLAERLYYAMNHTEVVLEIVEWSDSEPVSFNEISGLTRVPPKTAISARVRHEFALSIPLASKVFTASGESGTYNPASVDSDNPAPPGEWTMIETRAILTNEGIDRRLPPAPPAPRF